ncbi:uncharacterized protein LOC121874265 [Homarus americanus]|uniref:uncharacterized protein LOC121874265 n=1 Tax=Homarus americanus TaxID=6706 RepID=UPI001C48809A|nr:uncharacterized protein LOC121874265 [Homarus americanus]
MKSVGLVCVFLAVVIVAQEPSFYSRKLTADQLRDFPGLCFGSTTCRVYNVTESWAILPFCGKATCVKEGDALFEVVSECARAKPRADCNEILVNPAEVPFPDCCPTYNCTGGPIEYYTQAESEQLLAASASLPNAGPATGVTTS